MNDQDPANLEFTPAQMQAWTATVRQLGVPLVVTVHDLRNPHHPTRERHDAHLTTLLSGACRVARNEPSGSPEPRLSGAYRDGPIHAAGQPRSRALAAVSVQL